ncbi:DUF1523 family protein [Ruixingdingia sedimenti]|uniref:DUF1523 family protein n=1 Tax=Ruixingdingia sedimenti TaxID=3073604 RepID=A0ABU1F6R2_9RHOB|nr:DUF1523 family protein [Xinfangfangia sp. LG-4]MDR5652548.1 DUF1523 family protein [Xinfangfangia sp. LG-4]
MRYVKWTLIALLALLVFAFFHYTLPQRDIVRIVGTHTQRMDLGENAWFFAAPDVGTSTTTAGSRDIKFIETMSPRGRPMVYRNEDTGWSWPPYFKVNSFNLQTQAGDLVSTAQSPRWVAITHYGWRNEFFSIFPNAVAVREVSGPDATLIPWVNIVILTLLALAILMIWRMLAQFRERMIDPVIEDVGDALDRADERADRARDRARGAWGRFTGWLGTWRGRPRR